nr:hypothetical protein GCM10020185_22430 [Pseudomonas brassicacearum subsp. brassicacearum]
MTPAPGKPSPSRSTAPAVNGAFFLHQGSSHQPGAHRRGAGQRPLLLRPARRRKKLKIDITQTRHHRGYGAVATEQLDPTKPSDLKETFDMGLHLPADHPDVLAEKNPCVAPTATRT